MQIEWLCVGKEYIEQNSHIQWAGAAKKNQSCLEQAWKIWYSQSKQCQLNIATYRDWQRNFIIALLWRSPIDGLAPRGFISILVRKRYCSIKCIFFHNPTYAWIDFELRASLIHIRRWRFLNAREYNEICFGRIRKVKNEREECEGLWYIVCQYEPSI